MAIKFSTHLPQHYRSWVEFWDDIKGATADHIVISEDAREDEIDDIFWEASDQMGIRARYYKRAYVEEMAKREEEGCKVWDTDIDTLCKVFGGNEPKDQ